MKILVVSDTHRYLNNMENVLKYAIDAGIKHVIHCGDHIFDAEKIQQAFPGIEVFMVPGNCDFSSKDVPKDKVIVLGGIAIYFTHGDKHQVKYNYDELLIDAKAHDARIGICGHTHKAYLQEQEGVILLNPGSISEPRDSVYPSYAIIEIKEGRVEDVAIMQILEKGKMARSPYFKGLS